MLYYIHGYQSNPNRTKGTLFRERLNALPIHYRIGKPEDLDIADCLRRISKVIQHDSDAVLIGSSLGGFLAAATALTHTNVTHLILLNPAIIPPSTDLNKYQTIPQRILHDMVNPKLFNSRINAKITILSGIDDDVIPHNWILEFAIAQKATITYFQDDHMFSKNMQNLPDIISAKLIQ